MNPKKHIIHILLILLTIPILTFAYFWFSTDLPSTEHLRQKAAVGNTRILDRHGHLLYEVPDPFAGWQQPLPLSDIPSALQHATIAIEDRRFYAHSGVDPQSILRAAWDNAVGQDIVSGGSTITQQLARTFLLDPEIAQQRSIERKLREMVLALKLSTTLAKDEILTLYLNQTYYGRMAYGVEAAAQRFFDKPARDLDLAESALLAGLPQAPSAYDPLNHFEAARIRQRHVLDAMVREGFITESQAAAAWNEPLQFASAHIEMHAPHFVFFVLETIAQEIAPEAIARGGLTITTTLDLDLQHQAEESLQRHLARLATPAHDEPHHQAHNGAVVVLDPADGAILAMVGSPNFYHTPIQGQVNGATALRQPGSAIKPLTYAAALERGWTPATMIMDAPVSFPTREGRPYTPENYDSIYHGPLSLREALATSSNVAAVQVLHQIGVPALLDIAQRLGITSWHQNSGTYGLALTLGGGEVTLLELTSAYAAFANEGVRVVPYAVMKVSGDDCRPNNVFCRGVARYAPTKYITPKLRSISPQVAYLISDILSDPYARMRAFGLQSVLNIDRPAVVKTGTTTDWRDNWTIGYTPDRVVGVWVGNADGSEMVAIDGLSGAGPVWHDVMLVAHKGLPPRSFVRPDGIVEMAVCQEPGVSPDEECTATRMERFIAGTEPTPLHASSPQKQESSHAKSDAQPANAQYIAGTFDTSLQLVYPPDNAHFTISSVIPADRQQIELQAQVPASSSESTVTLVVNGTIIATFDDPPYRAFWQLQPGDHHAWVETHDESGRVMRSKSVSFTVATH